MADTDIVYEPGPVALLRLNRPSVLNALTESMVTDARQVIERAGDDPEVRVVLISGEGRGFCAGADLKSTAVGEGDDPFTTYDRLTRHSGPLILALRRCPKPVIAAVHGPAVGAGMSLALACDLLVAAESARFGQVFTRVGLCPDLGSSFFLPRAVGTARAREMMLFGEMIEAAEAQRLGMVNRVFPDEVFDQEARAYAERLASGPTRALAAVKRLVDRAHQRSLAEVLDDEAATQSLLRLTEDHREGAAAFKEKRSPEFRGK